MTVAVLVALLPGTVRATALPASLPCAPLASVPLADVAGFIVAVAWIDGRPVSLVVDTGSDAGLIDRAAVPSLGLAVGRGRTATLDLDTAGARALPVAIVRRLGLGGSAFGAGRGPDPGLELGDVPFPVGTLPQRPNIAPPVVGLLGGDVLHHFAVEFDLAHGRLTLWRDAPGCGGAPPWAAGADRIALAGDGATRTIAAMLDGTPVTALLDSGARSRIVSTTAAGRVGVSATALGAEPGGLAAAVGVPEAEYHWHRFRALRIGRELDRAPVLTVAPIGAGPDMLLGADWFARHHLWISYATDTLWVAREKEPS